MMSEELKRCPFCGCKVKINETESRLHYFVEGNHKPDCYIGTEIQPHYFNDQKEALRLDWNTRVSQ